MNDMQTIFIQVFIYRGLHISIYENFITIASLHSVTYCIYTQCPPTMLNSNDIGRSFYDETNDECFAIYVYQCDRFREIRRLFWPSFIELTFWKISRNGTNCH